MQTGARPEPVPLRLEPVPGLSLSGESAGDGPAIVLAHGLTATRRNVVQGSRHLSSRGFRLIGYDARGHGESTAAPDPAAYEYSDLADDLAAVLDALDLERPVLVGSSMGAATALRFALGHPARVRALVLVTPPAVGDRGRPPTIGDEEHAHDAADLSHWDRLAAALDVGDLDAFVEESGANALPERWREPARLATRQRLERHRDLAAVADAVRVVSRSQAVEHPEALDSLDVPVLVVGSRDEPDPGHPLAHAEQLTHRLPRGELVVEEPGDTPLAWQGARLSRAIDDFLDRAVGVG